MYVSGMVIGKIIGIHSFELDQLDWRLAGIVPSDWEV